MSSNCCVCLDDQKLPENPLLTCDGKGCNVSVHKGCYGVQKLPESIWFCRKCESQERVARVRCELCPSRDGALKRTDKGGWCHVVCALFMPEADFLHQHTLEPIILDKVPSDKQGKMCSLCEKHNRMDKMTYGACIQCAKSGCKITFHVTCGQSEKLLVEEKESRSKSASFVAYCPQHIKKGMKTRGFASLKPLSVPATSSNPDTPSPSSNQQSAGKAASSSLSPPLTKPTNQGVVSPPLTKPSPANERSPSPIRRRMSVNSSQNDLVSLVDPVKIDTSSPPPSPKSTTTGAKLSSQDTLAEPVSTDNSPTKENKTDDVIKLDKPLVPPVRKLGRPRTKFPLQISMDGKPVVKAHKGGPGRKPLDKKNKILKRKKHDEAENISELNVKKANLNEESLDKPPVLTLPPPVRYHGPPRPPSLKNTSISPSPTTHPASAPSSGCLTMEELLEWQWDQAGSLLMKHSENSDIVSLLSCLHQLKKENDELEATALTLSKRRDHLHTVNARLKASLVETRPTSPPPVHRSPSASGPPLATSDTPILPITPDFKRQTSVLDSPAGQQGSQMQRQHSTPVSTQKLMVTSQPSLTPLSLPSVNVHTSQSGQWSSPASSASTLPSSPLVNGIAASQQQLAAANQVTQQLASHLQASQQLTNQIQSVQQLASKISASQQLANHSIQPIQQLANQISSSQQQHQVANQNTRGMSNHIQQSANQQTSLNHNYQGNNNQQQTHQRQLIVNGQMPQQRQQLQQQQHQTLPQQHQQHQNTPQHQTSQQQQHQNQMQQQQQTFNRVPNQMMYNKNSTPESSPSRSNIPASALPSIAQLHFHSQQQQTSTPHQIVTPLYALASVPPTSRQPQQQQQLQQQHTGQSNALVPPAGQSAGVPRSLS